MKITLLAVATLLSFGAAHAQKTLNPGDNIPNKDKTLQCVNGKATSFAKAMGQNGLLVMFSCNTCPFVIKNQPITQKTIAYAATHHIGMVILNSNEAQRGEADSYDAMKKYASAQNYTVPYLVDENSAMADLFGASHTPEVYLFNKDGRLMYKGAMNDNPGSPDNYKTMYVEDAINSMIAGRVPDPSTTKSIGCGIKRKA